MITLAINTASSQTSIALFKDTEILQEETWKSNNDEAEKLMPAIEQMLNQNNLSYENIDQIYCVKGPGSFTGLRIGVTVANTISYLTNAKLCSISTFEYLHHKTDLPVIVYAGSGGVYLSESINSETELLNLEEINQKGISEVSGDITDAQKEQLTNIKFTETNESFGATMLKLINEDRKAEKIIHPLYIKSPSITKSKKTICFT